jgi:hypothetical protein
LEAGIPWAISRIIPFYMLLRMYLPEIEVLKGQYVIPGVVKAK